MSLQASLSKGAVVAGVSAVLSVLVLDGFDTVGVFNMAVPKFLAQGVILGASSVITDYTVPHVTPYLAGGSVPWTRFEALTLEPLLIGTISLGLESVLSPQSEQRGGILKTIAVGGASSITAAYVSAGMGWSSPIA